VTAKVGRFSFAVQHCPSPNHGERLSGPIDILLLHYTGMPDADQSLAWLTDPASKVSSHYFVFEDGRIVSLVDEGRRAWHAGASQWGSATDINSRSIGIEIANSGHPGGLPDFPQAQIDALIELCRDIVGRRAIPPRRVLAHSDVSPGRKLDPGERFPWTRLAAEGVGHWTKPRPPRDGAICARGDEGEHVATLQALLALYGYAIDVTAHFEQRTEDVVAAFQRHFRQERVDGRADRSTIETLRDLIEALP
jgi:N-acetylmuramoyl-L-alanine amidase